MKANNLYLLCEKPRIVAGSFGALEEMLKSRRQGVLMYHLPGFVRPANAWKFALKAHRLTRASGVRVIMCSNEPSEAWWLRCCGVSAICFNHNMHVNEHFFNPLKVPGNRKYKAVYIAALAKYKRLELASAIRGLYVVTYKCGSVDWDLADEVPALVHADWNSRFLSPTEVRDVLWNSQCGLALSAREGAMWASMEYLMAGLPVVSTPSRGGRSRYADPRTWLTVEPTAEAVARGVDRACAWTTTPHEIRTITLQKVSIERRRYANYIRSRFGLVDSVDDLVARWWGSEKGLDHWRFNPADS